MGGPPCFHAWGRTLGTGVLPSGTLTPRSWAGLCAWSHGTLAAVPSGWGLSALGIPLLLLSQALSMAGIQLSHSRWRERRRQGTS